MKKDGVSLNGRGGMGSSSTIMESPEGVWPVTTRRVGVGGWEASEEVEDMLLWKCSVMVIGVGDICGWWY